METNEPEVIKGELVLETSYGDLIKEVAIKATVTAIVGVVVTALTTKMLSSATDRLQKKQAKMAEELRNIQEDLKK